MNPRPAWADRIIDMLLDPVCAVDRDGRVVFTNAAYQSLLGYSERELLGIRMMDLVHPDDRAATENAARAIMAGVPARHFRNRYRCRDGSFVHLMWSARWSDPDGVRIAVARDMTQLVREEAMASVAADLARAVLGAAPLDAVWRDVRAALARHFGFVDAVAGVCVDGVLRVLGGSDAPTHVIDRLGGTRAGMGAHDETPDADGWRQLTLPCARHDARLALRHPAVEPIAIDHEMLTFLTRQIGAVVNARLLEEELSAAALQDPLTGLPNRRLLADRTEQVLGRAQRDGTTPAILFVDLDDFKRINDRLGHAAGDAALLHAARVLSNHVRATDTVARIGGDEFALLLDGVASDRDVTSIVEAIDAAFAAAPADASLPVTRVSIGSARYPRDGTTLTALLDTADRRMYQAKSAPRSAGRGA